MALEIPADKNFEHERSLALRDTAAAAEFLDLQPRTLEAMRVRGDGPKYVKLSRRAIKYRLCDLIAWVEGRQRTSTSDEGQANEQR